MKHRTEVGASGTTWDITPPPDRRLADIEIRYVSAATDDAEARAAVVAWLARLFAGEVR